MVEPLNEGFSLHQSYWVSKYLSILWLTNKVKWTEQTKTGLPQLTHFCLKYREEPFCSHFFNNCFKKWPQMFSFKLLSIAEQAGLNPFGQKPRKSIFHEL